MIFDKYKDDLEFLVEFCYYLKDYLGCEILFYFVESLIDYLGGVKIYFKREDFNYFGFYKLNNVLG